MIEPKNMIFFFLIAIIIVGLVGIPMGDPKFLTNAILLESSFIALAILTKLKPNYVPIPSLILASIVIIGNTVSPKHVEIMSTLNPPANAVVLIIGGYILQGFLLISSLIALKKRKQLTIKSND